MLRPDGRARAVQVGGPPGTYLKIPVSPSERVDLGTNETFAQGARRIVTLNGAGPELKTWIADDDGRTVAHSSSRTGERRASVSLRLPDTAYYLFVYFSRFHPRGDEQLSAVVRPAVVPVRWPDPPPAPR